MFMFEALVHNPRATCQVNIGELAGGRPPRVGWLLLSDVWIFLRRCARAAQLNMSLQQFMQISAIGSVKGHAPSSDRVVFGQVGFGPHAWQTVLSCVGNIAVCRHRCRRRSYVVAFYITESYASDVRVCFRLFATRALAHI